MTGALHQRETEFRQELLTCLDGLYGYAMSLSRNQAEAEDLVQETYLRAVRSYNQLTPDSNLKGWIYRITRNIWLNEVRDKRKFSEIDDEERENAINHAQSNDNPHASYVAEFERAIVRDAVEQLPEHFREVIQLREFQGLSYQEIADILQCPVGTIMSRLGRARDKLRMLLSHWRAPPVEPKRHEPKPDEDNQPEAKQHEDL